MLTPTRAETQNVQSLYNFVGPKALQTQIRRIAVEFSCSRVSRVSCLEKTGKSGVCGRRTDEEWLLPCV